MTDQSLTKTTASGLAWSWGAIVATTLLQLVYTAVMSRLLAPADFGLMAATLVGLRFVTFFSRFGLASAVIQRPDWGRDDESTAMRLGLALACAAAVATVLASPLLAAVVKEPETAAVMRWMALAVACGAIGSIPEALMRRRFRFRALALIQVLSFGLGYLAVGIGTAYAGWGVWSLVAANIAQVGATLLLSLAIARPNVRGSASRASAWSMLRFGGAVTATGFLEFLSGSIDTLSVGRWVGSAGLGQYSRATLLAGLPVEQATTATSRVLLPSLSRTQSDHQRYSNAVITMMGILAVVVIVPIAMISAAAPAAVNWLLGSGWDDAAAVLPIVGSAYGFGLLTNSPAVAAEARGAVGRKLRIQLLAVLTTSAFVALAVISGPSLVRLASAWAAGELMRHIYYWLLMFSHLGIRKRAVAVRYSIAAALGVAGAAPVFISVRVLDHLSFWAMLGSAIIGLGCAAGVLVSPLAKTLRADVTSVRQRLQATT